MNINALEKLARHALKGNDITAKTEVMAKGGIISPAEHRSLKSLSWQIAANVQADNGAATMVWAKQAGGWI